MSDESNSQPPANEGKSPVSEQSRLISTYWDGLAAEAGGVPKRTAFDPLSIPTVLPTVFLIEWLVGETYKVRLQGTAFAERGAVDLTGMSLAPNDNLTAPRSPLYALLDRILTTPCGLYVVGIEQSERGRQTLVEFTAFPLTDDNDQPRFIVGTAIPLSTLGYVDRATQGEPLTEVHELREIKIKPRNGAAA